MTKITPILGGCEKAHSSRLSTQRISSQNNLSGIEQTTSASGTHKVLSMEDVTKTIKSDLQICISSLSTQITSDLISPEAAVTQSFRLSQMMTLLSPSQRLSMQGNFETLQSQLNIFLSKVPNIDQIISPTNAAQKIAAMAPKLSSPLQYIAYRDMIIDAGKSAAQVVQKKSIAAECAGTAPVQASTASTTSQSTLNTTQNSSTKAVTGIFGGIRPLLRFIQPLLGLKNAKFTSGKPAAQSISAQNKGRIYPQQPINPKEAPAIVSAFQKNPSTTASKPLVSAFQSCSNITDNKIDNSQQIVENASVSNNQKISFDFNVVKKCSLEDFITPYVNSTV